MFKRRKYLASLITVPFSIFALTSIMGPDVANLFQSPMVMTDHSMMFSGGRERLEAELIKARGKESGAMFFQELKTMPLEQRFFASQQGLGKTDAAVTGPFYEQVDIYAADLLGMSIGMVADDATPIIIKEGFGPDSFSQVNDQNPSYQYSNVFAKRSEYLGLNVYEKSGTYYVHGVGHVRKGHVTTRAEKQKAIGRFGEPTLEEKVRGGVTYMMWELEHSLPNLRFLQKCESVNASLLTGDKTYCGPMTLAQANDAYQEFYRKPRIEVIITPGLSVETHISHSEHAYKAQMQMASMGAMH